MAKIKQRLESLERELSAHNEDKNIILIMLNDDETLYDAISRHGYDPNSNLKKFIFVSWLSGTK